MTSAGGGVPESNSAHELFTDEYFDSYNYADRGRGRWSMYWFARRYYAALVRRYAPKGGGALLELGSGLVDLLALLQDDFRCTGIDLIDRGIEQTHVRAPRALALRHDIEDLSMFAAGEFNVVVALHVVEHLTDPEGTIREVRRILRPGGLFLFATPNPNYRMRRYKDPATDAIGKDPTHINVQPPDVWRRWLEQSGFDVLRHFGDGLWDVPYLPRIPTRIQFAIFGLPALMQVLTRTTYIQIAGGVNQVCIATLDTALGTPAPNRDTDRSQSRS
jgi:SAM-dependent methyltransferase